MIAINDVPALARLILAEFNPRREALLAELGVVFDRHPLHEYLRIRSDKNLNTWRKYSTGLPHMVVRRALLNYHPEDEPVLAMGGLALDEPDEPDEPDESDEPDEVDRFSLFLCFSFVCVGMRLLWPPDG